MNTSDNNFDDLKRLLKLKRHEVPPPGYFNNFSGEVISRIRAGEAGGGQTLAERLNEQAPWLTNFLRIFETKPGLIGAFATCLCLLLVLGVVFADRPEFAPKDILATTETSAPAPNSLAPLAAPAMVLAGADQSGIMVSTNPVISLQPTPTLFGQQNPLFQSASFAAGR